MEALSFSAFSLACTIAKSDISTVETCTLLFKAIVIGIQPEPVPISKMDLPSGLSLSIQSTNSSVSGRGIKTCSLTENL